MIAISDIKETLENLAKQTNPKKEDEQNSIDQAIEIIDDLDESSEKNPKTIFKV